MQRGGRPSFVRRSLARDLSCQRRVGVSPATILCRGNIRLLLQCSNGGQVGTRGGIEVPGPGSARALVALVHLRARKGGRNWRGLLTSSWVA